ncbi:hypothetical protein M747DRAFT_249834 [Aspergillus niger ATCC 13496]|uniref:Contig An04c0190, genomic contig n=3 Tax=Aspergillus niger TaxID=5061 RepID=A2QJE2_ASPNC|nr:uncharacterized protein An04g06740 [Aspergillus niger]RDH14330.1 hypothetical protein M747DRAFT_249834 [Aspergillus niger ATCC 13496]CAK44677.1 unnamed protein product [Aspergillus niger]
MQPRAATYANRRLQQRTVAERTQSGTDGVGTDVLNPARVGGGRVSRRPPFKQKRIPYRNWVMPGESALLSALVGMYKRLRKIKLRDARAGKVRSSFYFLLPFLPPTPRTACATMGRYYWSFGPRKGVGLGNPSAAI